MKHPALLHLRPLLLAATLIGTTVLADQPPAASPGVKTNTAAPVPTRHQLMKDCMAKQKAAGSGKPKYELSQDCRDITKTEKENAEADQKQAVTEPAPEKPAPL
jgi:hypothetical protein